MRINSGVEWAVKEVVDKRMVDGEVEYKVVWDGDWADTWQPASDLKGSGEGAIRKFLVGQGSVTKKARGNKRARASE